MHDVTRVKIMVLLTRVVLPQALARVISYTCINITTGRWSRQLCTRKPTSTMGDVVRMW